MVVRLLVLLFMGSVLQGRFNLQKNTSKWWPCFTGNRKS